MEYMCTPPDSWRYPVQIYKELLDRGNKCHDTPNSMLPNYKLRQTWAKKEPVCCSRNHECCQPDVSIAANKFNG